MPLEQSAHRHTLQSHVLQTAQQNVDGPTGSEDTSSDGLPDIFSLIAQESLQNILKPALCHVIEVTVSRFPNVGLLYRLRDEIYLGLDVLLQTYCMKKHEGTFSENFYGMKRVPIHGGSALTHRLRILNLLVTVLHPYIRNKMEDWYFKATVDEADGKLTGQDRVSKMRRLLVKIYPLLHSISSAVVLSYLMRFLLGSSNIHSPLLHICLSRLQTLQPDDNSDAPEEIDYMSQLKQSRSLASKLRLLLQYISAKLPALLYSGFSVVVFFLQFLQWYSNYERDRKVESSVTVRENIPPPRLSSAAAALGVDDLICPLCKKTRSNSTVISTSGYVFCYPCIYKHLQSSSKCPVTGLFANTSHLIKLYMPET